MNQVAFFGFRYLFRSALALAVKAFPISCVYRAKECLIRGRFAHDKYGSPMLVVPGWDHDSFVQFWISGQEARLEIHDIRRGEYGADTTVFVSLREHGATGGISTMRVLPSRDVDAIVKATAQRHCAVTIRGALALQIAGYYGNADPLRSLSEADARLVLTSIIA